MLSLAAERGLTLIEMAVTVSLIALLAMWVAPDVQTWVQNTQIRGAAESIASGLQRARNEALRNNRTVQFTLVAGSDARVLDNSCAATANGSSWIVSVDAPGGQCGVPPSAASAPRTFVSHAAGEGHLAARVTAVAADGSATSALGFDGFGRVVGANPIARIDVTSHASGSFRALRVAVSGVGAIRMCDPAITDANDPRRC